ncbi:hypothetical protein ERICI_02465 [Paenibacillus larvae subsp. larvae]|uniref:Uncharacterized protein n=1 Tax=Paenibacillus larvae subsp. larvae TaxID=147375 RepID=A0A2L1TNQ7_9BACL|nr:hypothetical protein ERICI_02465 [Paenibacillus larvae subsp. larvae]AVF26625.1 hypothetical protein ERICIII_02473 [Paenibacillus larvae subsp. larvae]AVF31357.1 hypothetical protein ERICIV_02447 [Paenibacillus larvae subsp. larvae]ETK26853.1 hypothetical protein ERIC1_1c02860 [Paenibacillus larvae subsp. larvae DSM 25719]QHZ51750.1 hypothetical protein ERICV_02628 [Paenibacillus larvae subsp. larvae]
MKEKNLIFSQIVTVSCLGGFVLLCCIAGIINMFQ